ncbi:MAG: DUF2232 domain-containing protein [Pseudomonadota bacterium]
MRDVAIAAVVAVVLYSSGLLVILTPLSLLYIWVIHGRRLGFLTVAMALAAVAALYANFLPQAGVHAQGGGIAIPLPGMAMADFVSSAFLSMAGIGYFLFYAVVALTIGEGVRRQWNLTRWCGTALLAGLAVFALVVAAALLKVGGGIGSGFRNYLGSMIGEVLKMNQTAGKNGADLGFIADHVDEIVSFMVGVAPALIFVFALVAVVVNILLGRRLIHGRHAFAHVHNVARFRLPDYAIWGVIGCGLAFFADHYAIRTGWLEMAAVNCMIGVGALYFFQGLAVVVYFLQGVRLPLIKMIAYGAIIFFFQTIGMVIVAIGVADVWVDFRLRSWKAKHGHQA